MTNLFGSLLCFVVKMRMKTIIIMKKKKKSTEEPTNITENFQWLAWRHRSVRIPRRVIQRHSEACGQQQQLEVDGVSRDNWIPAPQRQTQRKHGCGVTQALSLFCNIFLRKSCAGQQGHGNLSSETEFELKLTFKLYYAMWDLRFSYGGDYEDYCLLKTTRLHGITTQKTVIFIDCTTLNY